MLLKILVAFNFSNNEVSLSTSEALLCCDFCCDFQIPTLNNKKIILFYHLNDGDDLILKHPDT